MSRGRGTLSLYPAIPFSLFYAPNSRLPPVSLLAPPSAQIAGSQLPPPVTICALLQSCAPPFLNFQMYLVHLSCCAWLPCRRGRRCRLPLCCLVGRRRGWLHGRERHIAAVCWQVVALVGVLAWEASDVAEQVFCMALLQRWHPPIRHSAPPLAAPPTQRRPPPAHPAVEVAAGQEWHQLAHQGAAHSGGAGLSMGGQAGTPGLDHRRATRPLTRAPSKQPPYALGSGNSPAHLCCASGYAPPAPSSSARSCAGWKPGGGA